MNLMSLRYVVEIDRTRSISKAAENLYMSQPNLSRAIKDLEQLLHITVFKRTNKGIEVTAEGEEFIQYAKKILADVEFVEKRYQNKEKIEEKFSILGPRASYIGYAFLMFTKHLNQSKTMEITYKETNSLKAINKVLQGEYRLGIIRYRSSFEKYYQEMFLEKGLESKLIYEFKYHLLVNETNPLCRLKEVKANDLNDFIEVCYPDPYVPNLPFSDVKKIEFSNAIKKRIYIYERATKLDLLENLDNTFMWVSPIPQALLNKYHLVELEAIDNNSLFKDVLIYKKGYQFTKIDCDFLNILDDVIKKMV